jgi:hypothetical protein
MTGWRSNPVWFGAGALAVFACSWMGQGAPAQLRHFYLPLFLLGAIALFAPRLRGARPVLARALVAAPALVMFTLLVGAGGMASHGALFAAMSHDFWHADLLVAPDRRPLLPVLAYILPPWPAPYAVVWYATFAALFLTAWDFLTARGLAPVERFALLTGSILAYLLIIPGYTEVLTFLVALLCWRAELTAAETCVAAAVMIGGHEVAGGFAIAFLAIESDRPQRLAWLGALVLLGAAWAAGYLLAAGSALSTTLDAAARPAAGYPLTAPQLVLAHPWRCLLGIAAAYKLTWLLLPAGLRRQGAARLHAVVVLLSLPLLLIATDTSRIVQFSSLSMLALAATVLAEMPPLGRRAFTALMILVPSICAGTNGIPAWGKGFYAVYLYFGQRFGISLGGVAP